MFKLIKLSTYMQSIQLFRIIFFSTGVEFLNKEAQGIVRSFQITKKN